MWHNIDQVIALIQEHLARRPAMAPQDVYKLLYQGVRGPEHIIASPEAFAERLQMEWEALGSENDDPLWESIHPDGALRRLNLRPFKAAGGDLDVLTSACLETSRRAWGTQAELQLAWNHWNTANKQNLWPGAASEDIAAFTSWLRANGFPAVHHSEKYRHLYRPAYRLVAAEIEIEKKAA